MNDDDDFVLVDEMRKSRERLRAVVGVDGYDLDLITWAAERIEELEKNLTDPAKREKMLKLILGPDGWEDVLAAMGEAGQLEVLGWKGPEDE